MTETTFGRNELFYYRKRKWQSLVSSAVNDHVKRGILTPLGGDVDGGTVVNLCSSKLDLLGKNIFTVFTGKIIFYQCTKEFVDKRTF